MPSIDPDADMSKKQYDLKVKRYMKKLQAEVIDQNTYTFNYKVYFKNINLNFCLFRP